MGVIHVVILIEAVIVIGLIAYFVRRIRKGS